MTSKNKDSEKSKDASTIGRLIDVTQILQPKSFKLLEICNKIPLGKALELTEKECLELGMPLYSIAPRISYLKKSKVFPKGFHTRKRKTERGLVLFIVHDGKEDWHLT
jgi:hypothetical protein